MIKPKPIERQRRLIREELLDHARNIGYVAKALPELISKQEWTFQKAVAMLALGIYAIGLSIGGFIILGGMYIKPEMS